MANSGHFLILSDTYRRINVNTPYKMAENTTVRSAYIQQIEKDRERIAESFAETAKASLSSLLDESIKKELRQIISEGDSYTEDETDDPTKEIPGMEGGEEETSTDVTVTSDDEGGKDDEADIDVQSDTETSVSDENGDEEWEGYEKFRGEDGQYDFTGMDQDQLVKVFRQLGPEDGVSIVPKGDNAVSITDNETERTYIVDFGGEDGDGAEGLGESKDVIDNYQKDSAMTVDSNKEVANPKTTYSMDGGVPQGTEKPFPGNGDGAPYDKQVEESFEIELEGEDEEPVNENDSLAPHSAASGGVTMSRTKYSETPRKPRNSADRTTSENPYNGGGSANESRIREALQKANEIFEENKQLRKILSNSVARLQEAVLCNKNMGNIVKLMMEHATTSEEKHTIATRFGEVKTLEESKRLYETISGELKGRKAPQVDTKVSVNESVNNGIGANRPMYQSNDMTDFMRRMDDVYRRKR